MPVTIYDIADGAGVSIATVSRVLNGHARVAEPTRQRVEAVAERLGYEPHAGARGLALRRTGLVAAVAPMMTSPFYAEVLRGVQDRLAETDYDLLVYAARSLDGADAQLGRAVERGRSDALLVLSAPLSEDRAATLATAGRPVALVDVAHPSLDSVTVDSRRGGAVATQHLLGRGHRRVALLLPNEASGPARRRRDGYRDALAARGIPPDPALVVAADWDHADHGYTRRAGYLAMRALLDRFPDPSDRPTAVFAVADVLAYGALRAAREAGLSVPGDLDVVGFDDVEPSAYAGLTTVRQPMAAMGRLAAEMLARRLDAADGGGPPQHVTFAPTLVVRETTGGTTAETA